MALAAVERGSLDEVAGYQYRSELQALAYQKEALAIAVISPSLAEKVEMALKAEEREALDEVAEFQR